MVKIRLFALTALVLAACAGDQDPPTALSPSLVGPAKSLSISPDDWQLVPGEMKKFTVVAKDEAGNDLPNPQVSWVSQNPSLADFLTPGDRNRGILTAQDDGSGPATIAATVDGQTAFATVMVVPLSDRVMVIDSTELNLLDSPPGGGPGEYRFEIVGTPDAAMLAQLATLENGSVQFIAGDQGATFFRHVSGYSKVGNLIVLQTEKGNATEVFKGGGRANGKMKGNLGPRGQNIKCEDPNARGMKCKVPKGLPLLGLTSMQAAPGDMTSFPDNLDLCVSPSGDSNVSACLNASAKLSGSFDASVDIDMVLSLIPAEFTLVVGGGVSFALDYEFALKASAKYELEKEIVLGSTPFSIFGIPGKVEYLLIPGIEGKAGADFTLSGYITGGASARAGFTCSDIYPDCERIKEASQQPFVWNNRLEGTAGASVALFTKVQIQVKWLGIEPYASIGPFFELNGTASEFEHLVTHPVPVLPRLEVGFDFGVEAEVGVEFTILGVGDPVYTVKESFDLLRLSIARWWAQSDGLKVTATTTGMDLDPDGYALALARETPEDPPAWSEVLSARVARSGEVGFTHPPEGCFQVFLAQPQGCNLVATYHELRVHDVSFNCSLDSGGATRQVHLHPYSVTSEAVVVVCKSAYEAGGDIIDEMLREGQILSAGVGRTLRGRLATADAARQAGRKDVAENMLTAFINLVEAQTEQGVAAESGKQIRPGAGARLIQLAILLKQEYLNPPTRS